jgi:hypothetical protein
MVTHYNLCTTEAAFIEVAGAWKDDADGDDNVKGIYSSLWKYIEHFRVLARMSPRGKADVIQALHATNPMYHALMCGDGKYSYHDCACYAVRWMLTLLLLLLLLLLILILILILILLRR